jgi:bacterial/archaeal transporter family-2 protein
MRRSIKIIRFQKTLDIKVLSILSGFFIALQSRINGELSNQMGDSLEAALVSFGTGLIFVSLISLFTKDVREGFANIFKAVVSKQLPLWRLSAGVLGASFVAMQTHVVPIVGVALFTVASLAGQTAISLWVDHVGLAGGIKSVITKRRVIAAIITVGAVVISAWDRFVMSNFSILAITLAVFAGSWVGVQRALNGQINSFSRKSFATSQLNFITGFSFLTFLLVLRSLFTDHSIMNLTSGPWWMFLGGSIGVFYIAFSAVAVQYVGVLEFTLLSVGGMLIGSLLLDVFVPTQGTQISPYLIVGIFLTYLGVIANGQSRFSRK